MLMSALASRLAAANAPVRLKLVETTSALEAADMFSSSKTDLAVVRGDVGAQRVGESIDLNFAQPVSYRALDDGRGQLDLFVFGQARRLAQSFDQLVLFRFGRGGSAGILFGPFSLLEGGLLLDFPCCGQQFVDFLGHG